MKRLLLAAALVWCLPAVDATATTRYAGLGGSDANTCAQSTNSATPKRTYASAKTCIVAGDTLKLLAGSNFTEQLTVTNLTGTSGSPILIEVDSGTVTFTAQSLTTSCRTLVTNTNTQWVTISGANGNLVWDGSGCADDLIGNRIDGPTNFTMRHIEIKSFKSSGFYLTNAHNITLDDLYIHDQVSPTCVAGAFYYGMYLHDGTNVTLTRSRIQGNPGGGVQLFPGPLSAVSMDRNVISGNNSCATSRIGGIIVATDSTGGAISGVSITHNLIYGNGGGGGGGGIRLYATTNTQTGTAIYNNTIYGNLAGTGTGYGINIQAAPSGTLIKNNHIVGNATGQIIDAGTGTVQANNRTTGTVTDCTVSTSNFTHKAASSCIDAGTNVGLPYNGSAPDIGAFETFVFASCEVPFSAANTIQATFTSNANLLGSTLTTFTARRNGSNNALTGAASKIGDTIVSLPITTTYVGGDTADISWSSGGFTDNALIGGSLNQPYVQTLTNQSCTNNAGGVPTYNLNQAAFRYHGVYGGEDTPDIRSAENVSSYNVVKNGAARLRVAVTDGTANAPPIAFYLRYSHDGGAYTPLPNPFGADNIASCGERYPSMGVNNGQTTSNQLTTSGPFVPAAVILDSIAIPTITGLNVGYKTELEYCVAWNASASGTYTFRLYEQSGTALSMYTVTPSVSIIPPQATGGP